MSFEKLEFIFPYYRISGSSKFNVLFFCLRLSFLQ